MATRPGPPRPNRSKTILTHGFLLYRFYDKDSVLLYIGQTCRPPWERFKEHHLSQDWRNDIARMEIQRGFTDQASASAAECEAIEREHPKHNKTHNGGHVTDDSYQIEPGDPSSCNVLLHKYFHTTERCEKHGAKIAIWQGHIVGIVAGNKLLIELFDWLVGQANGQQLITLDDFMAMSPLLYESGEDMCFSYNHGYLRHTDRCE